MIHYMEYFTCNNCSTPCILVVGRTNDDIRVLPTLCIFDGIKCSWVPYDPIQTIMNTGD